MKKCFAVVCAACLLAIGCIACDTTPQRYEQAFFDVFDTVTTLTVYDTSEKAAEARIQQAHDLLTEYHQLYDIYHAYEGINNLYTVNENAGKAPVTVDERILDLVQFSKEMYALTDGRMNIAMGGVFALWSDYREAGLDDPDNAALPPMAELERAAEHADIDDIVVDREAGTLYLADADLRIDVGRSQRGMPSSG
jgi:thiamine biosynthesis lipoprotein